MKKILIPCLSLIAVLSVIITITVFTKTQQNKPNIKETINEKIDEENELYQKIYSSIENPNEEKIKELIKYCKENNLEINEKIINYFKQENFILENLTEYINYPNQENISNTIEIINNELQNTSKQYQYQIDEFLVNLKKEKYYIKSNIERYINYYINNKELSTTEIVTRINSHLDTPFYENMESTDISKGKLMIVNKHYKLNDDYVPDDLVPTSTAGYGIPMQREAYEAFLKMHEQAETEGIPIFIVSPYRSIADQRYIYNDYVNRDGQAQADTYSARPGNSEHNTGYAMDVAPYIYQDLDAFENTPSFYWMQENGYKYGFILRYPKGKEYITGYIYEPWHYRYVGIEAATIIHNENITFEEYYEYYVKEK